jgi:hypothetical protein
MNATSQFLVHLLHTIAAAQIAIAVLNLFLVRLLKWEQELKAMPLLLREVFQVHAWFISVSLLIFGTMTWRFAAELAHGADAIGRWLCAGIGLFWGIRTVLQITYYSSSHWRGQTGRTAIHLGLLLAYGGMALIYLWAGLARGGSL